MDSPLMQQALSYVTLSNWLLVVASMRLLALVLGYTYPAPVFGQNLETQLFDIANSSTSFSSRLKRATTTTATTATTTTQFTPLAARTFAIWTAVTCIVCVATSSEPTNTGLLRLCALTFVTALAYFTLELMVYKTVSLRTVIRPAIIASISVIWCWIELGKSQQQQGNTADL